MRTLRPSPCLFALVLAAALTSASAAPLGSSDPAALPPAERVDTSPAPAPGTRSAPRPPAGTIERVASPEMRDQSKTVEMLLEMQGKNPGLQGGEPVRQDDLPAPRPARPGQTFSPTDAAQPFGAGDAPRIGAAPAGPVVEWNARSAAQSGGYAATAPPRGDEGDVRWLIPRPVVAFLRENRELVLAGSVLILLLFWGLATLGSRRRK